MPTPNKRGTISMPRTSAFSFWQALTDLSAANPADDYKQKIYSSVFKTDNTWRESASWDYSNYWFFVERKGFYRRSFDGSSWKSVSDTIWPDAPAPFRAPFMKWHPMHGLLVSEASREPEFPTKFTKHPVACQRPQKMEDGNSSRPCFPAQGDCWQ